jgi:hypothetical protein
MKDKSADARAFGDDVYQRLVEMHISDRPVVFCLCEQPNLLNQWRDYGRDVVPYCLGMTTSSLLDPASGFPVVLLKLIYNEEHQRDLLRHLVDDLYRLAMERSPGRLQPNDRAKLIDELVAEVRSLVLHYKHPAFSAEQEWRLVAFSVGLVGQTIQFRPSTLGVVPYFQRRPREGVKLPITRVWVGPSPYAEVSRNGLNIYLGTKGYGQVQTEASSIPKR